MTDIKSMNLTEMAAYFKELGAVSYTHLDVYKRQTLAWPNWATPAIGRTADPCFWSFSPSIPGWCGWFAP